ncbi:TPA: response regulator [Vibrio vulnificus]|uniref:response regulator n=1 Tax=Vibrio vulnificus TaxID=672 RepID=UPI000CD163A0|nr:response regulator [Vibrio vulnificus]EHZ7358082.1 response regulator [Vibrio vulnificus]EID4391709.1 response regulator [Vibrio vulnificus]EIU7748109.1 response regulator [Vibrio vulnificus]EJN6717447.1 response regulator [Vibrio vulnificus]EJQ9993045.1 response regulator [Vibrio vulnificus]
MYKTHSQTAMTSAREAVQPKLIQLVDDDPIFRRITSAYLESQGYKVVESENGLQALQQLRECDPDIVLCDLSMPVLDGIEFVEEVSLEYPSLPLIVVSATGEMSDVAKALRFGIKDFLPKPIGDYQHLAEAIENTLEDSMNHMSDQRDFSSQWFRVDGGGELPDEQELHWHLNYLEDNPNSARDLLHALLPDKDTSQGDWKFSYKLLQSIDMMPLVFDYRWLMNGQFAFYLVDSASVEKQGVATALLIRALFDDYLRNLKSFSADLKDIVEILERGIRYSDCACPVNALFGIADLVDGSVEILPAGLDSQWSTGFINQHIPAGNRLGHNSLKNFITRDLNIGSGSQLTLGCLGSASFSLNIIKGSKVS